MSSKSLSAAILIIGNEILSGRTLDKNTQYIAEKLGARGVRVVDVRVVPDIENTVVKAVNELRAAVDYLFTTGGIGPTHDDITAQCIAKAVGAEFETNQQAYKILEAHYGIDELTPARARMARMPAGATLVPNPVSAAPGFIIENIHVMAGVPKIMQAMLDHILPTLGHGAVVHAKTVVSKLPESALADALSTLQDAFPDIEIGSYPSFKAGNVGVSVVLRSTDEARLWQAAEQTAQLVRDLGDEPQLVD